ncbi:transposase [Nocardia abscessus]|uniref:transposase n=1 Tax=Nocardia abscessus TaxID=120957 RepID=UPI002B4B9057|nr:transposase [Nocardia abscessus]
MLAARIVGRTGRAGRFPTAAAYANYTAAAPVEIASGDSTRHRLSRYGDRELNSALHTIAMIQIRMRGSAGRAYYDKKIAEGRTPKEAKRCLKRRLADLCWRTMIRDERRTKPVELARQAEAP